MIDALFLSYERGCEIAANRFWVDLGRSRNDYEIVLVIDADGMNGRAVVPFGTQCAHPFKNQISPQIKKIRFDGLIGQVYPRTQVQYSSKDIPCYETTHKKCSCFTMQNQRTSHAQHATAQRDRASSGRSAAHQEVRKFTIDDVLKHATQSQKTAIVEQKVADPNNFLPVWRNLDEEPRILVGFMDRGKVLEPSSIERARIGNLSASEMIIEIGSELIKCTIAKVGPSETER